MSGLRALGLLLVVLGFLGLLIGEIPYNKTENIAQIGDLKMKVTEKKQATIPPAVSGIAILLGAVLLVRRGTPAP